MPRRSSKGFSLIEVIVALAIIGIIGVSLLGVFTMGIRVIVEARDRNEASFEAQSQIEADLNTEYTGSSTLTITLPDSTTIEASGIEIPQSATVNGKQVEIDYFKPRK